MDIEEFIKVEHEDYYSAELAPQCFPYDFYNHESEADNQETEVSIDQVIIYSCR